jgi:hypothetical protein
MWEYDSIACPLMEGLVQHAPKLHIISPFWLVALELIGLFKNDAQSPPLLHFCKGQFANHRPFFHPKLFLSRSAHTQEPAGLGICERYRTRVDPYAGVEYAPVGLLCDLDVLGLDIHSLLMPLTWCILQGSQPASEVPHTRRLDYGPLGAGLKACP